MYNMNIKIETGVKLVIQSVLLLIFIKYFGLTSWQRYQAERAVMTSAEEDAEGGIPSPAVTVCAFDPATNLAFRNKHPGVDGTSQEVIGHICKGTNGTEIVKCVEKEGFNLTTTVKEVTKGIKLNTSSPGQWFPEFSFTGAGLCHTLDANMTFGTNLTTESLRIELNNSLSHFLMIHDPNFFLLNLNPGLPFNFIKATHSKMTVYSLIAVKHHNIDVPSKRCNPDPSYTFTRCIKEGFSREVGCRLHWDRWTDQTTPVCHSLEQYR